MTSSRQPPRDLRMLCLHGYRGTGAILRRQMAPLAAAIPSNVELVYVDAPSVAAGSFASRAAREPRLAGGVRVRDHGRRVHQ